MKIIRDGIWCCVDCLHALVNNDYSGIIKERRAEVEDGVLSLGAHIVPTDDYNPFSKQPCACCGTTKHGERWEFNQLGERSDRKPRSPQPRKPRR